MERLWVKIKQGAFYMLARLCGERPVNTAVDVQRNVNEEVSHSMTQQGPNEPDESRGESVKSIAVRLGVPEYLIMSYLVKEGVFVTPWDSLDTTVVQKVRERFQE